MRLSVWWISVVVVLAFSGLTAAQVQYRSHMLVKIMPDSEEQLKALGRYSHLDLVPGETHEEPYLVALPEDLEFLRFHGFRYEILQDNLERFYAERLDSPLDLMGGYKTYAEIVTELDAIHAAHPTITTAKFSIGNSLEGRPMWVMKISDNPEVDEGEPEVFYNSLIHAREPAAMEAVMYFMNYLTDNYASNAEVADLVNNRELYFLPCVNPDGYVYNQTTNPNGGGMWRKNRRLNGDGSYGVDLNRNWDAAWGLDNDGSSPFPSDPTYRGTAPFSEIETQHLRDFINTRQFVTQNDYHTYGNWVLYPWGTSYYDGDGLTVDNPTFEMLSDSIVYFNHSVFGVWYTPGTPWMTLYNTNGGSFDWEYEEQVSKPKIFAMTTEVGGPTDGFWPAQSRILPLAQENLPANMFLARIAGLLAPRPYAATILSRCQTEWNGDGNGGIEPGEGFTLTITLRNSGLESLNGLHGVLTTLDPHVTILQNAADWPNLDPNQTGTNGTAFTIAVLATSPAPHLVPFSLHLTSTNGLDSTVAFDGAVGFRALADNVEGGVAGWTSGGSNNLWHISARRSQSPTHSWFSGTESGNYANSMSAYLLSDTLILGPGSELSFDHWYSLEADYDYAHVEINTGNGWVELGTPLTGSSGGWIHVTHALNIPCAGTPVQLRFRMTSDGGVTDEGWYVDNISTGCQLPPDIDVSPPAISAVAPLGGTDSEALRICNQGECPLTWSVTFDQITPAAGASTLVETAWAAVVPELADMSEPAGDKSSPDGRRGADQLDDQGGPDSFGYRWKDSAEPGGPVYNWVEVTSIGTRLNFTGDDQALSVALPWSFPFYGSSYTTVNVSANGNLHFGTSSTAWSNVAIPTAAAPNSLIAPFWDDLSPQLSGSVYYYNDVANSRFIVQYDSVPHYVGVNNGRYTFEAILYQTGRIVYQYQSMVGDVNSATVGIENQTGTDGLQVVYNANYITNNLAVALYVQSDWLTFGNPVSGSLTPGQCTDITLNFAAGTLPQGTYTGNLHVTSSDPDENLVTVPVTFTVGALVAPNDLTIAYDLDAGHIVFRWSATGAPRYRVYSAITYGGPYSQEVGSTTGTTLTAPLPAAGVMYYIVVASD